MSLRTVLIGLDGATFSILDPLMRAGTMPFLKRFVREGVRAPLRSVIPALTPPAWTSLMTGQGPGRHGIFDFFRKESAQSRHLRLLTSRDVGTETIWSFVSRHGLRVTVLNFPLMFPAPRVNGHVVPGGWMPWRQLRLGCYPEGLYDRLKALPGFNPRDLAMDAAHEEKAIEGCRQDEYEDWIDLHIRREQQWFNVLRHLAQEEPADLCAVLFDGVDKVQHLCWRFVDPAYAHTITTPWEARVRDRCLDYFRVVDGLLAGIAELAGPGATLIMTSDHGFGAQIRTFFVNGWLARRGDLAWADGAGPKAVDGAMVGVSQVARHAYLLDWTRTRAYSALPSGNGIYIVRVDPEHPAGVSASEYEAFREGLMRDLLAVRDPQSGEPVVSKIWKREEVFAGPWLELAPDLTLELQDGGFVSIMASETPILTQSQPRGTHHPDGIFIARGPGLRQGLASPALSILDVMPLLLHSLDLAIPARLEGRVPTAVLEAAELAGRPVRIAGDSAGEMASSEETHAVHLLDEEAEAEIVKRLRALGYVE